MRGTTFVEQSRGANCWAESRGSTRIFQTHVWHGSRCDVVRKSAGNKPLISSTSTYPINQSSLNAYCSGISSVIKPKLADISINPINWFVEIEPSGRNNCAETKSLWAIISYPSSSWKNFEKNCEFVREEENHPKRWEWFRVSTIFKIRDWMMIFKGEKIRIEDIENIVIYCMEYVNMM